MTEGEDQMISGGDNLLSGWTITSENIQMLRQLTSLDFRSLDFIHCISKVQLKYSVFTANFQKVVNAIQSNFNVENGQHNCICLEGPKGCGKTHTLVATFVICSLLKKRPCLFLAQDSFEDSPQSTEYLKEFVNTCVHFSSDFRKEIESVLDRKGSKAAIDTMLLKGCRAFMEKAVCRFIRCNSCASVTISRFNEDKASSFLKSKGVELELNEVLHLTGTNPFLLSQIREKDTVAKLTGTLRVTVEKFPRINAGHQNTSRVFYSQRHARVYTNY